MNNRYLFTSESVTEGHPDKIADQITDAILDAVLEKDPSGRVGIEALVSAENITVAGQIESSYHPDIPKIVYQIIKDIGYTESCYGLNPQFAKLPNRQNVRTHFVGIFIAFFCG